jgi:hypothetical protein
MGMSHVLLWPVLLEWRANRKSTHAIKGVGVIYLPQSSFSCELFGYLMLVLFYPRGILGAAENCGSRLRFRWLLVPSLGGREGGRCKACPSRGAIDGPHFMVAFATRLVSGCGDTLNPDRARVALAVGVPSGKSFEAAHGASHRRCRYACRSPSPQSRSG